MSSTHNTSAPIQTGGRARAPLSSIRLMWGSIEIDGDRVIRTGMYGRREVWRLISGRGEKAVYEKVNEGE